MIFKIYSNVADLQRVNFCCTVQLFNYTHIGIFHIFSIMVYHSILNIVPCTIEYDLVIYPKKCIFSLVVFQLGSRNLG